jgi:anaphase-promoting complex subunit 10
MMSEEREALQNSDHKAFINSFAEPKDSEEIVEIGEEAVWILSSAKAGNGIEQLRDSDNNTFWQ